MASIKTEQTEIIKIKAKVKILVKIIGVAGIIILALIPYLKCCQGNSKTHHLKILHVTFTDLSNKDIRISGRINEISFSYPTTGFALKPSDAHIITPQYFTVTEEKKGFECYFEVIVLDTFLCKEFYYRQANPIAIPEFVDSYQNSVELSTSENLIKCKVDFVIY